MVPGLAPFGGPHCRPRIPLQPAGQPIFPHGSIDQVIYDLDIDNSMYLSLF